MLRDYHVHTDLCDGKDTLEAVGAAAREKGLEVLGFTGHCYTEFDKRYCMSREDVKVYRKGIAELNRIYAGAMKVLCGIEQDIHGTDPAEGFDHVIGSVHYIRIGNEYLPVDESPELLMKAVRDHFGGDIYGFVEAYYDTVSQVPEVTGCDIIGHFDLITKFNEREKLLDEKHPRYIAACLKALDILLKSEKTFEINTGAISRGYKSWPYPSREWMEYIRDKGGRFILNSDSHSAQTLCYQFDKWGKAAEELGLNVIVL